MRIHIMGRHAHRTPFAYDPYKPLFKRHFEYVERPDDADVILFGYVSNIDHNSDELARLREQKPDRRLVVVSEEPLWDTTFSDDFWKRHSVRMYGKRKFAYSTINHYTSDVYAFKRIPYFLTTTDDFFVRYANYFRKNAGRKKEYFETRWGQASISYAFFAEFRDLAKKYEVAYPELDTYGLSVYRTKVAQLMPKGTLRVGQGWGEQVKRQALPDWHLDKIVTLRGRARVISALENTSQRNYISEKLYDAFACGGIPLYWCPPSHRANEVVPPGSFVNLHDLSPDDAVKAITGFQPDATFLDSYWEAQQRLAETFRYFDDLIEERFGFADRISAELNAIVSEPRP